MEKGRYDKNASHPHSMTLQIGHTLLVAKTTLITELRPNREINIKRDTMSTIIKIFKNLGTIVILLFQIGYVSIVDYIRPYDKPKPKQSDTKNKTATERDVCWNSSDYSMKDEQQESIERSHRMVEWSENPHYTTTNTKHEPE